MTIWELLDEEWHRCQDAGFTPRLWWRDDDAVTDTPLLQRLVDLTEQAAIPLLLAVIPVPHQRSLILNFMPKERIGLAVHGYDHQNHAADGTKKSEFPLERRATDGPATLFVARQFGAVWQQTGWRGGDIFVPPWNRLDPQWYPDLVTAGFRAVSQFGPRRSAQPVLGLTCVNTHIDVMDWSKRVGVDAEILVQKLIADWAARREGRVDRAEPTGILTHHLVHDGVAWDSLKALIDWVAKTGVEWVDPFHQH